ncbi:MAG TPA: class I SAM-dependent methyltransferase [Pseudonocardiaceae bacterium]
MSDIAPANLERALRRAEVEGLAMTAEVADAQALPFENDSFDVVLSTFGVMYAPDHKQAAAELLRVCRPVFERFNRCTDGTLAAQADYLEIIATVA